MSEDLFAKSGPSLDRLKTLVDVADARECAGDRPVLPQRWLTRRPIASLAGAGEYKDDRRRYGLPCADRGWAATMEAMP